MKRILFRADALKKIGTGDLMSLIQLSKYFAKDGWEVSFLTKKTQASINMLEANSIKDVFFIEPNKSLSSEIEMINSIGDKNKVPAFFMEITERRMTDYENLISIPFKACVCFDGFVPKDFVFVLDWGINSQSLYDQELNPSVKYLLGPRYVILPISFNHEIISQRKYSNATQNVLVAMGGGDEYNLTLKIVTDLLELNSLTLHIILGAGYEYEDSLSKLLSNSCLKYKTYKNIKNMFAKYMECDVGIGAGGLISSELVATKTPTILISTYEHQIERCQFFDNKGLVIYLGHKEYDKRLLQNFVKTPIIPKSSIDFNSNEIINQFNIKYRRFYANSNPD